VCELPPIGDHSYTKNTVFLMCSYVNSDEINRERCLGSPHDDRIPVNFNTGLLLYYKICASFYFGKSY